MSELTLVSILTWSAVADLHELHKGEKVTPFVYIPGVRRPSLDRVLPLDRCRSLTQFLSRALSSSVRQAPTKDHSARHARLKAAKAEVDRRKAARKTAKTNKLKAKAEAEGKIYVEASAKKKEKAASDDGEPVEPDSEDDGQEDAYDS